MEFENDPKFEALKSRLQQNPDSLLFARVAEQLLNKGQVDEATRICEEGTRKHPYYVTGRMVLGKCYLQKKMFDLAEKEFKRVLLFDPKYIAAHKFYGDLMREAGWPNACEMSYKKILAIDPLDRSAKEMLETLERVKPKEQAILTPGEDAVEEGLSRAMEIDSGQVTEEYEEIFQSGAPRQEEPAPATESIDIDDDLFADVTEEEAATAASGAAPETEAETPAPPTEDVTSILDDIFEDDLAEETRPDPVSPAEEAPAAPVQEPVEELPEAAGLQIEDYTAPETQPEAPQSAPAAGTEQPDTGKSFDEETIEFDQMNVLEEEASENLKPVEDSVMDMIETPAAPEETQQQEETDFSEATEEIDAQDIVYDTDEIDTFASPQIDEEDQPDLIVGEDFAETPQQSAPAAPAEQQEESEDTLFAEPPLAGEQAGDTQDSEPEDDFSGLMEDMDAEQETMSTQQPVTPEPEIEPEAHQPEPGMPEPLPADEPAASFGEVAEEGAGGQQEFAAPEPQDDPAPDEQPEEQQSRPALDREKIVTPTLGEIYAAQGQFAKAINVFEMLLKKDPTNEAYLEKIEYLKQRLEDNQDA